MPRVGGAQYRGAQPSGGGKWLAASVGAAVGVDDGGGDDKPQVGVRIVI